MKTTSKLFLVLLALGLGAAAPLVRAADEAMPATPTAPAKKERGGKHGPMAAMAEKRLQDIDAAVTLTPEQKQKIKDIWAKEAAEVKALPEGERRGKAAEAMKAGHDQVRAVLTPEQQVKFDAMPAPGGKGKAKGKKAALQP